MLFSDINNKDGLFEFLFNNICINFKNKESKQFLRK